MRVQRWMGTAVVAVALGPCAFAQQQSTITKVVFRNAGLFAQADLEAVTGIHAGSKVTLAQMQTAAQHLVDTNCFDDVHLDSSGSPAALTLVFILKPTATQPLYPAAFENLVWFTPEELRAIVHRSAPLFSDRLPETGAALDAVLAALQTALAEKGVPQAQISAEFVPATDATPEPVMAIRLDKPVVEVGSVTLEGVPSEFAPTVNRIATKLRGTPFIASGASRSTDGWLLSSLLDAGYLDARLTDVHMVVGTPASGVVGVDLSGTVAPGPVYRVGSIAFGATPVVTAQAFATGQQVHSGDVASRAQLLASEAPLTAAYHKLGYMYAYVDPGVTEDTAAHTVSYALRVVPGAVFALHSVNVQGLSPEARAQFDLAWTMKPGDPYNADYVRAFLANNSAMRSLAGYSGGFQAAADADKHQVDLTVTFVAGSNGK